jgi:hypothetical protein
MRLARRSASTSCSSPSARDTRTFSRAAPTPRSMRQVSQWAHDFAPCCAQPLFSSKRRTRPRRSNSRSQSRSRSRSGSRSQSRSRCTRRDAPACGGALALEGRNESASNLGPLHAVPPMHTAQLRAARNDGGRAPRERSRRRLADRLLQRPIGGRRRQVAQHGAARGVAPRDGCRAARRVPERCGSSSTQTSHAACRPAGWRRAVCRYRRASPRRFCSDHGATTSSRHSFPSSQRPSLPDERSFFTPRSHSPRITFCHASRNS